MTDSDGADQFTRMPDPADAKNRRAGTGDGDRLAFVERMARSGYTLQAGEGALLVAEIDRLRALVAKEA